MANGATRRGGLPAIGAKVNPDDRVFSTSGDGAISVVGGNNPAGVRAFGSFYSVGVQNIADNGRWPGIVDPVNAGTTRGVSLLNDDYYPRDASYHYFTDFGDRDASIVNLFFNQEILKDFHFEAGYQREDNKNFGASYMAGGNGGLNLNVDPNRFLADGVTPIPMPESSTSTDWPGSITAGPKATNGGPRSRMSSISRNAPSTGFCAAWAGTASPASSPQSSPRTSIRNTATTSSQRSKTDG